MTEPVYHVSDRAVIRLAGDDVRGFLQGLVTQDVLGALPVWAGLLSPQGKHLFDFFVWGHPERPDTLFLDVAADDADALIKRLSLYRLRRAITIEPADDLVVLWAAAPTGHLVPDPRLAALGARGLACAKTHNAPDGRDLYADHRWALGVAEGAALRDILWLETNAAELGGVSFTKGCYVGQENTARMNWRQKINRRLFIAPTRDLPPDRLLAQRGDLGIAHLRVDDWPRDRWPDWLKGTVIDEQE